MSRSTKIHRSKISASAHKNDLSKKAKRYDRIVRTLLDEGDKRNKNQILIFNHHDGFISTDIANFGKYSIRLY